MAHGVSDLMLSGRLRETDDEPVGATNLGWLLVEGLKA